MSSTLAAIDLAQRFSLIPIRPRDKRPLIPWEEFQTRRATEAEVRDWLIKWPDMNLGVVTGAISGLVVLDVDGAVGLATIQRLLAKGHQLPHTVRAITPGRGGGSHYFFRHPGGTVSNRTHNMPDLPGCDVRGNGGYIVVAPSVHPEGGVYAWAPGCAPWEVELAEMPSWLADALKKQSAKTHQAPTEGKVPEGQRNAFLAGQAGAMRRRGMVEEVILAALLMKNTSRCEPHLPEEEVRRIAASISKYPPTNVSDAADAKSPTQSATLVRLASGVDLFSTPAGVPYGTLDIGGVKQTWPLRSENFRLWLGKVFYEAKRKPPGGQALQDAVATLAGMAVHGGPQKEVYLRLAGHDGAIYLDLANKAWEAVKVTPEGWAIVTNPPVCFRRPRGTLALPYPVKGGNLNDLRRFINLRDDKDFALFLGWLVNTFKPTGPYPNLTLHGEQGAAKSTAARIIKNLIDPHAMPLRAEPRELRDLAIAAQNCWLPCFDNLSHLPPWLSDALCRLATGGGMATRTLYTNEEETFLDAQRPVVITGIEELLTRADLLDRAILLYLPSIPKDKRRTESALWAEFEKARPALLGALLDAVAVALRRHAEVALTLTDPPRMADAATWATAAEPGLGLADGAFMEAYAENQESANALTLEASPVSNPLLALLDKGPLSGTATKLLAALNELADEETKKLRGWPKSGQKLSNALRRLASTLRAVGVSVEFDDKARPRGISLRKGTGNSDGSDGGDGLSVAPGPDGCDATDAKKPLFSEPPQAGEADAHARECGA